MMVQPPIVLAVALMLELTLVFLALGFGVDVASFGSLGAHGFFI